MFIGNSLKKWGKGGNKIRKDKTRRLNLTDGWNANLNNDKWLINIFQGYINIYIQSSHIHSISLSKELDKTAWKKSILDKEK